MQVTNRATGYPVRARSAACRLPIGEGLTEVQMAGQERNREGNADEKRAAAREARRQGKRPSETRATTGASKQRKEADGGASHQERLEQKHEGKRDQRPGDRARPGSRDHDPKRTDEWG